MLRMLYKEEREGELGFLLVVVLSVIQPSFMENSCVSHDSSCDCYHGLRLENRAASASRSHSEAEKRRRDRINTQMNALRKIIPDSDKMDKATLLASAVRTVKTLKRNAAEAFHTSTVPSETDEAIVNVERSPSPNFPLVRASLSFQDCPEAFSDISGVIQTLRVRPIRAEITTIGGRLRSDLVMMRTGDDRSMADQVVEIKQALSILLNKMAPNNDPASSFRIRSKRQRLLWSSHCHQ